MGAVQAAVAEEHGQERLVALEPVSASVLDLSRLGLGLLSPWSCHALGQLQQAGLVAATPLQGNHHLQPLAQLIAQLPPVQLVPRELGQDVP